MMASDTITHFGFTFGASHTQSSWGDARHVSWQDMVEVLTSHVPGAKEGSCLVPAIFTGSSRKKEEAAQIDVAFLDSDSGATLDDIVEALKARGWEAVVSSTHSHMTTNTIVSSVNWDRYFAKRPDATAEEFLIDEKGYLPTVAAGAVAVKSDPTHVHLEHAPCPKFRVAVPLSKPWRAADYPSQAAANAAWKACIEALAYKLDLPHDQACTDTSRLFYLPRRPPNGAVPETAVVSGEYCDIFSLQKPVAPDLLSHAVPPKVNGHHAPTPGRHEYIDPITGEIIDLTTWARTHGRGFLIAKLLNARRPAALTGLIVDSTKVHIRCPNESAHTHPGPDGATFVVNAGVGSTEGFVIHCRHAHCTGQDRLFFVNRMLSERWIEIDDLTAAEFQTEAPATPPPEDEQPHTDNPTPSTLQRITIKPVNPAHIEPRQWAYGRFMLFGSAAVIGAVDGHGKGLIAVAMMLSMITGRPLLGERVWRTGPVAIVSYEDDITEWHRRIAAACIHYAIDQEEVLPHIHFITRPGSKVTFGALHERGSVIFPDSDEIIQHLQEIDAVMLLIDPFNHAHSLEDGNSNVMIAKVAAEVSRICHETHVAGLVLHHLRKGGTGSADDLMGAVSLRATFRACRILVRMTPDIAEKMNIKDPWRYVRIGGSKENYAPPPEKTSWFRLDSVALQNSTAAYPEGDDIGVATSWKARGSFEGMDHDQLSRVFEELRAVIHGPTKQAKHTPWAAIPIMQFGGRSEREATGILKSWLENGVLTKGSHVGPGSRHEVSTVALDDDKAAEILASIATPEVPHE